MNESTGSKANASKKIKNASKCPRVSSPGRHWRRSIDPSPALRAASPPAGGVGVEAWDPDYALFQ